MGFLGFLLLGLIAGAIAKAILPGEQGGGWLATMILGVVGALLGGFIAGLLGINFGGWIGSFIIASLGAILLLFLLGMMKRR